MSENENISKTYEELIKENELGFVAFTKPLEPQNSFSITQEGEVEISSI